MGVSESVSVEVIVMDMGGCVGECVALMLSDSDLDLAIREMDFVADSLRNSVTENVPVSDGVGGGVIVTVSESMPDGVSRTVSVVVTKFVMVMVFVVVSVMRARRIEPVVAVKLNVGVEEPVKLWDLVCVTSVSVMRSESDSVSVCWLVTVSVPDSVIVIVGVPAVRVRVVVRLAVSVMEWEFDAVLGTLLSECDSVCERACCESVNDGSVEADGVCVSVTVKDSVPVMEEDSLCVMVTVSERMSEKLAEFDLLSSPRVNDSDIELCGSVSVDDSDPVRPGEAVSDALIDRLSDGVRVSVGESSSESEYDFFFVFDGIFVGVKVSTVELVATRESECDLLSLLPELVIDTVAAVLSDADTDADCELLCVSEL
jgi:hypothetical protein